MSKKKTVKGFPELTRVKLREKYGDTLFDLYTNRDLSAHHKFVDSDDPNEVLMSFTLPLPHRTRADIVLASYDGGETWYNYKGPKKFPPQSIGTFGLGKQYKISIWGMETWRTYDGGYTWTGPFPIRAGDELAVDGLGVPNAFSAIVVQTHNTAGRIVIVADYFLGQEGPDGQLVGSFYSDDWGNTWHTSRLFFPSDPLPFGPEGFGEPAVVELPSGWLWMVMRCQYGELWQCISRDGGASWNHPTPTGLVSPIANCYAKRDPYTGATVLCWNLAKPGVGTGFRERHSLYRPRKNLVFSVSRDNTRTWSVPVVVDEGYGQYPTIHFTKERMFVMYQKSEKEFDPWTQMGLELVAYDREAVIRQPAWNLATIQPYIDAGLVRHWRALACQPKPKEAID